MTQEVVRIGGAGVGRGVGRQSIRTSSSEISWTILSRSLVTETMSLRVLSASCFTPLTRSTSISRATRGPRLRIFWPSGESSILILIAIRYKSGSGRFERGKTGLPGSGTRVGARGEDWRGVRTVVTGEEMEGRMTLEGAMGVRVRPRVGMGGGGGLDLGLGLGEGMRLGECMRMVSCSGWCFLRCLCSL